MRRSIPVLARTWLVLTTAVSAVLPAGAAVAATALPHPVGGYIPGKVRTQATAGVHAADVLPESVDLRSSAPAGGDQGKISSCVAWTIGYSIMGYYATRDGASGAPYSPLFMYMRNVAAGGAPNTGLSADAVLAGTQANGIDTQDDYWQGNYDYKQAPTAAEIANAKNYKVNGWKRLFNGANQGAAAQTVIQQALAAGDPVALGMPVYRDFMTLGAHTLYTTVGAPTIGAHMVAVYGYDSTGVIIRNSWGSAWGNSGDAKLSWAFVTKAAFGAYTIGGLSTPAAPVVTAPVVAKLSSVRAVAGSAVTITGSGLAGATAVTFGDATATFTPQTVEGTTRLTATVPPHAVGTVDVSVTSATGTSVASAASKFTYIPPAPVVTSVSPDTTSILGGTEITLTGTDLSGVTSVKVGPTVAVARKVTATSLVFTAPVRSTGSAPVTVTNAYGTSNATVTLTYTPPPAPVVSTVTPASGPTYRASMVTLTGTDLTGATSVTSNGRTVPFTKVSATQLRLTLPVHAAGDVTLQVTTPGGTSEAAVFTYVAPELPTVTGITPTSGPVAAATPVVITGTGFTDATRVTSNGVSVAYTKISDTSLKVNLPPHAAGVVDLQVTNLGGASAKVDADQFTYVPPPVPVVATLTPSSGSNTVNTTVLLDGTDFTVVSKVTANGVVVPYIKVSGTQLKVTLAARAAGEVALVVTTTGGPSNAMVYTAVAPPAPVITALSVTGGATTARTPVTITGTGFTGATKVTIGGAAVPFTKVSDTEISIVAPVHAAGTVPVVVTGPGGPSMSADFTYAAVPTAVITGANVAKAPAGRASNVLLTGTGFSGTSKVTVGGTSVSFAAASDTILRITVPVLAAGDYDIVVTGPGGVSAASRFTIG